MDFLFRNKLFNPSQHGFLKTRSCLAHVSCFLNKIKWIDEGSSVDIMYLASQIGFENVPHQRFLLKLKSRDGIINWIKQRLTDKRQRVVVDGEVSNWK